MGRRLQSALGSQTSVCKAFLILSVFTLGACSPKPAPKPIPLQAPTPQLFATWPWPGGAEEELTEGVTRYSVVADDQSKLELFEFDLAANPRLRLGLYDQDQDDETPFDNAAKYDRKVDEIAPKLGAIVAWNGPFFAYDRVLGVARHIGPVVLNGKVRYNVGNHRWTFGVKDGIFDVRHLPSKTDLEVAHYDFAASGLQCLVKDGKPLKLEPFPTDGQLKPQPVPSTPEEAGHIPLVDHMRTSRTSLGWAQDSGKLYLLIVKEQDNELESKIALKHGGEQKGGWTLDDIQRFWLAKGAWGAVNSDGGIIMQRVYRKADGTYDVIQPGIPEGTLMTFYVFERG